MRIDSLKRPKSVVDLEKHLETKEKELKEMNQKLQETETNSGHKDNLLECYNTKDKLEEQMLEYL